jgi:hypothetical protein
MGWQEDALTRLKSMTEYGGSNIDYGTNKGMGHFVGWRTQAISALQAILGDDNIYTSQFTKYANYQNGPEPGLEILRRVISDIENGYLRKTANIISAEVFGDFLEMADHLLEQGYKDPAASLCGAVLEDGFRRIAHNRNIEVKTSDDLNSLKDKMCGEGCVQQYSTSANYLMDHAEECG